MSELLRPTTLAEALAARREHPDYVLLAGGTDFMVAAGDRPEPTGLIDIFGLAELTGVSVAGGVIRIGAATPYRAILADDAVREQLPSLHQCIREIGAVQIQARGTMGGNVATSSPVGDTLPMLLALDATVRMASSAAERALPYAEFCTGYRQTALAADELIVALEIPAPAKGARQYWRKVGTRRAQSIAKLSVAGCATLADDGTVSACRVAMGAVAALPIRLPEVEKLITGRRPDAALADEVCATAAAAITPIDDVRSSADYRRVAAANLARRFVLSLAE